MLKKHRAKNSIKYIYKIIHNYFCRHRSNLLLWMYFEEVFKYISKYVPLFLHLLPLVQLLSIG